MQPLLRFGSTGLLLLATLAAPAARADQPLDEPAPFGVIQFSPAEAWIDLPAPLADSWQATLAVLTELRYDVRLDATYMDTNGQIRVADLWVAVEPHGSPAASYTRVRVALDSSQDEYTQVRAEVILDAIATRLAPAQPAPDRNPAPAAAAAAAPAQQQVEYAEQPLDPGVQDVYTGGYVAAEAYDYATVGAPTYNTYNTYNTYATYPTPYYANYGYYAPCGNYFPYWSYWNTAYYPYGGWYGGYYASPSYGNWGYASPYSCYGYNSWWNFGFGGSWGNYYASFGYPGYGWGGCGGGLVVVWGDDDDCDDDWDDDDCDNNNDDDDGDDFANGGDDGGKDGKGGKSAPGLNPKADDLHTADTSKPIASGSTGNGGVTSSTPIDGTPGLDALDIDAEPAPRSGGFPPITVTHRERNPSATRFDPRTTVTRTVNTRTVASGDMGGRGPDAERTRSTSDRPSITTTSSRPGPVAAASTESHGSPTPGKVVRMSGPSFTPGFAGVLPGSSRPIATVGSTSTSAPTPHVVSRGSTSNPYAGAPAPVVIRAPAGSTPGPTISTPGTISMPIPRVSAPTMPTIGPAPRTTAPIYAPPPVSAPRVSTPAPTPRAPTISAPASVPSFGGSLGSRSSGSFGGGSSGGKSGGPSAGPSAGGSSGASGGSSAGSSSSKGGRGRP